MQRLSRRFTALLLAAIAACGVLPVAHAQSAWPAKAVRIVVPYPAGGSLDVIARILGDKMSARLGVPVLVENRSGAAGAVGTDAVAKAEADGYTLLAAATGPFTILPHLSKTLPYRPERDFAPISKLAVAPFVLVVSAKSSVRTVKELLAFARANPGKLTYGSQGNGSVAHLSGVMLDLATGIRTTHVPYKGFAAAVTDLIAGRIDMFFADTANVLTRIRAGDVVPVAVASGKRLAALPEVPTFNESGLQAFVADAGFFMVVPAKTPREIRERLTNEVRDALRLPEVVDKFKGINAVPLSSTAAELAEYLRVDSARWARVIREARITLE